MTGVGAKATSPSPARRRRTPAPDQTEPRLSTEQVAQVLALLKGSDGVELKVSVPDGDGRSTVASLGIDPLDAQIRQVVFFDTPGLALDRNGIVVRARRIQRKPGDAIVKLRPLVPDRVPTAVRRSPAFGVEVDAMPGGFVCSGTMKTKRDDAAVKDAIAGRLPLPDLLTEEQRALFAEHAPEGIRLEELLILGPINVLKLKFKPEGYSRRLVAELWLYPDGSRSLELSAKCEPAEAFEVAAETREFLAKHGVDLMAEQQTKTKSALRFFVDELTSVGTNGD
jgi:hypothetical protein